MLPNAPTFLREDGYILHPARAGDAQAYWQAGYCPMDAELSRLTGCKPHFTREEVLAYFAREGVLRDAIVTGGGYADDVLMAMLKSEWRARQTYSDTRR